MITDPNRLLEEVTPVWGFPVWFDPITRGFSKYIIGVDLALGKDSTIIWKYDEELKQYRPCPAK